MGVNFQGSFNANNIAEVQNICLLDGATRFVLLITLTFNLDMSYGLTKIILCLSVGSISFGTYHITACRHHHHPTHLHFSFYDTIRYDTIGEFNVDSKAEYTA